MPTETVTTTAVFPLETSQRKNERVAAAIEEWQTIAARMNELMPSVGPQHWRTQDTTLGHLVKDEFPDHNLTAHNARKAAYEVGRAWGSWDSNGRMGDPPTFGSGSYIQLCNCGIAIEKNDVGYGLKASIEPYKPEWWHIGGGAHQTETLDEIADGELSAASGELHLHDDGLSLHLSVKSDVQVLEWDDVEHVAGVDLGEVTMWALAVTDGDGVVEHVEMESGREYRHHRERLKQQRDRHMKRGNLREVKRARGQYQNYTDHMTHVASRSIVDAATQFDRAGIAIEDLTHYRETADDAIHDWPFAELQTKIMYKATEEGIPVKKVNPSHTSTTCRKCGHRNPDNRHNEEFACTACGYEVHADVNAAINIAR